MLYTVKRYQDEDGRTPFTEWMKELRNKDSKAASKIDIQISRAAAGNFGDRKYEREGVWEFRVNYGQGFRVYFAVKGAEILLLLIGGSKSTQKGDLNKAIKYLKIYNQRLKS